MWKEVLKESRTVKFTPSIKYGILKYVNDNIPEGTVISFKELSMGEPFEQIKSFALKHFSLSRGMQTGGIGGYLKHRGPAQVGQKGGLMCYNAGIVDYEQMGRGKRYTRNSTMKEYNFDEIVSKGWEPKPKHKKLTPEMEEDIDSAVADNEFAVSNKLSDKIKHILMETPEGKPARTKKDIREFNRRFPGIKTNVEIEDDDIEDMDSGCGCGCDGKEVAKAKVPAVRNAQYNTYVKFIKKVLEDEGGAAGMQNFIDAGEKYRGFKERTLKYVISDAMDHDDWLARHEFGDYYLYEDEE